MNVLIVDDELLIRDVIKEYCMVEGFNAVEAEDGFDAINKVKNQDFDIIIMDIMMPKLDGLSAYKQIKEIKTIPTIMLSARGEEYDKLTSFDLGVDDYMTKPFSPRELMARIKAVLKRTDKVGDIFVYKDLVVDFAGYIVTINDKRVKVTPKEFELLNYFIQNQNIALSREQLLSKLWGYDFFGDDRTVDTHIKMLRKSLGKYRDLITTVRGMGYKFDIDEK